MGTGRAVYVLGRDLVLKLALNAKGTAQNEVESDYMLRQWYGDVVTRWQEAQPDDLWLITERADTAKKSDFLAAFGCRMEDVFSYLWNRLDYSIYKMPISQETQDTLDASEKMTSILDMCVNFQLCVNDLRRKAAWGMVKGNLVIRDYGLTEAVYRSHYSKGH